MTGVLGAAAATEELLAWARAVTPWELGLVAFGLAAQLTFFARWVVQWIASERRGASHVPEAFWWLSLAGGTMLFVYYVLRGEPVGMLGQGTGWVLYARNLVLIRRARRAGAPPPVADAVR